MPPQELAEDDEEDIDEAELNLDKVEEDMAADYSDEEEDEILHIDEFSAIMKSGVNGTNKGGSIGTWPTGSNLPQRPDEILQSTTDAEAWNLEVERVAPQLKVFSIQYT
jgi:estrogen-related receptor beta like 1